jgi:ABC-type sugar transport system permease subunit
MSSSTGVAPTWASAPPPPPRRSRRPLGNRRYVPYYFLAPALIVLVAFVLWPMLWSLYLSFTDSAVVGTADWVGLDNYAELVQDPAFGNALLNTVVYTVFSAPISVGLALLLAIALNRVLPGRAFFRAVIFFPFVISLSIIAIAWSFMLDPQVGIVNIWLNSIGIPTGNGIRDPAWAMPYVILVGIWRNVGFFMVMFLAGLQSIPRELYEAAEIDGTSGLQRFRYVTLPLLSNTTMFVVIIASIFSFQAFDHIYVMTGGGPFFRTETIVMQIYRDGFENFQMGYASAVSWVLVVIVLGLSLLQLAYFNRRVVRY